MRKVYLAALACAMISTSLHAGEKYRLTVQGTYETRDTSGKIVFTPLTSASMIQDCLGTTNNYVLAYELAGNANADFIEAVNTINGEVHCIPFQLYVPTVYSNFDGNFVVVTRGDLTEIRRIRYFFGSQSQHSVGATSLTIKIGRDAQGNTNRVNISGQFQYFILPQGTNGVRICSGTFSASQRLTP